MDSTVQCPKCWAKVILEEMPKHRCGRPLMVIDGTLYMRGRDGTWRRYRLPERTLRKLEEEGLLSPDMGQPPKSPKEGTVYNFAHSHRAHDTGSNAADWLRVLPVLANDWD